MLTVPYLQSRLLSYFGRSNMSFATKQRQLNIPLYTNYVWTLNHILHVVLLVTARRVSKLTSVHNDAGYTITWLFNGKRTIISGPLPSNKTTYCQQVQRTIRSKKYSTLLIVTWNFTFTFTTTELSRFNTPMCSIHQPRNELFWWFVIAWSHRINSALLPKWQLWTTLVIYITPRWPPVKLTSQWPTLERCIRRLFMCFQECRIHLWC